MGDRYYNHKTSNPKPARHTKNAVRPGHYADMALRLMEGSFIVMPLEGKKPIANGWESFWRQPPSGGQIARWFTQKPNANVGLCLGEVIAVDIDHDDLAAAEEAQRTAFDVLGQTQFIRVGRAPRRTLFYRVLFVEAPMVVGWKADKVDLLASGRQSVIYGTHPDTEQPFRWLDRQLATARLHDLPMTSLTAIAHLQKRLERTTAPEQDEAETDFRDDYVPHEGERNSFLFWYAKERAATVAAFADLSQIVLEKNSSFLIPLDQAEALSVARSVWQYKLEDRIWRSGHDAPVVLSISRERFAKLAPRLSPRAMKLYGFLAATRDNRKSFSIPQQGTAEATGMSKSSVQAAIKDLIACGLLIDTGTRRGGSANWRATKLYRFGNGTPPAQTSKNPPARPKHFF